MNNQVLPQFVIQTIYGASSKGSDIDFFFVLNVGLSIVSMILSFFMYFNTLSVQENTKNQSKCTILFFFKHLCEHFVAVIQIISNLKSMLFIVASRLNIQDFFSNLYVTLNVFITNFFAFLMLWTANCEENCQWYSKCFMSYLRSSYWWKDTQSFLEDQNHFKRRT